MPPPQIPSSAYPTIDPCADIATPSPYHDPAHPPPRIDAALTFDGVSHRLILFSGVRGDESCQLAPSWIFQDMWAWDGRSWQQLHPRPIPPGRSFGALAFDSARGSTVLFGGGSADSDPQRLDTWLWDGRSWHLKHPAGYPSSPFQAVTYSSAHSAVIGLTSQAWNWTGSTWSPLGVELPGGITQFALADDPIHRELVLFGAFSRSDTLTYETWTLDGDTWHQRHPAHPPAGGPAYANYDPVNGNVVMFDGATYTWDGSDWTERFSATTPHARLAASMAFDADVGRTVLFGGKTIYRDQAGAYVESVTNELWSWNGTDWHLER